MCNVWHTTISTHWRQVGTSQCVVQLLGVLQFLPPYHMCNLTQFNWIAFNPDSRHRVHISKDTWVMWHTMAYRFLLKHGYLGFLNCGCDNIQLILGVATMETMKNRCYCQSNGFKKLHGSFSSLSRNRSGSCAVHLLMALVACYKTE